MFGYMVVASVFLTGIVLWAVVSYARKQKFNRLLQAPFPPEWEDILTKNIPVYLTLPDELKARLHSYINVFLTEKHFEGCGGQEITDEVRVTIAAQACLLLIGRQPQKCFPRLSSVLVYPHTYVAGGQGSFGALDDAPSARLGESWQSGAVVLAWDSAKGGAINFHDGQNVTLHEFAHQLDQEDGVSDGTPVLDDMASYRSWAHTFNDGYHAFLERVEEHKKTIIDEYGATNPAEFFATATEAFFEKPDQLHKRCSPLYDELKNYYQLNPLEWE